MNWTEPKPPTEGESNYDHVRLQTPLGEIIITWKSWKESPSYDIEIGFGEWIGCEYSLEDAKEKAETYLVDKWKELDLFLNKY